MRTIKFRAKSDRGYWVYGDLVRDALHNEVYQIFADFNDGDVMINHDVIQNTIGQFTGLTDKNGTDIYEGDIIRIDCHSWLDWKELESVNAEVLFEGFAFIAQWKNPDGGKPFGFPDDEDVESEYVDDILSNLPNTIEVIGNIHDNKIKEE